MWTCNQQQVRQMLPIHGHHSGWSPAAGLRPGLWWEIPTAGSQRPVCPQAPALPCPEHPPAGRERFLRARRPKCDPERRRGSTLAAESCCPQRVPGLGQIPRASVAKLQRPCPLLFLQVSEGDAGTWRRWRQWGRGSVLIVVLVLL